MQPRLVRAKLLLSYATKEKNMSLKLIPASVFDGKDIWEMLNEFPKNDNGFYNPAYKIPFEEFKEMLNDKMDEALGLNLGPGMVPQSIYWLYKDNRPVGISKLRTKLNNKLRYSEGDILVTVSDLQREETVTVQKFLN